MNLSELKINFLGIGAPKCGTTWLSQCLSEHPQIFVPSIKEVNFFDQRYKVGNYKKGLDWYERFFNKPEAKDKILGEYTTHYMYYPDTHKLIKKHFPNVKLIVTLRKPWEMAYSLFRWKKANFTAADMPDSFADVINDDSEFINKAMFGKHLKKFYDLFPNENILLILHDEIRSDPDKVLKSVYTFLGTDPAFKPPSINSSVNPAKAPKSILFARLVSQTMNLLHILRLDMMSKELQSSKTLSRIYTALNKSVKDYPPLNDRDKEKVFELVKEDMKLLAEFSGKDLTMWFNDV